MWWKGKKICVWKGNVNLCNHGIVPKRNFLFKKFAWYLESGTAINSLPNCRFSWILLQVFFKWKNNWSMSISLNIYKNLSYFSYKNQYIDVRLNTYFVYSLLPSNYTYIINNNLIETRSFLRPCFSILFWCPCLSILARLLASIITRWAQSIFSLLLCKYIEQSLRKCYLKGNNF